MTLRAAMAAFLLATAACTQQAPATSPTLTVDQPVDGQLRWTFK